MNCMDCKNHLVIPDPDPNDWFCHDDVAIVCKLTPNPTRNTVGKYLADSHEFRSVSCSVRPYRLYKEGEAPLWCPLNKL